MPEFQSAFDLQPLAAGFGSPPVPVYDSLNPWPVQKNFPAPTSTSRLTPSGASSNKLPGTNHRWNNGLKPSARKRNREKENFSGWPSWAGNPERPHPTLQ